MKHYSGIRLLAVSFVLGLILTQPASIWAQDILEGDLEISTISGHLNPDLDDLIPAAGEGTLFFDADPLPVTLSVAVVKAKPRLVVNSTPKPSPVSTYDALFAQYAAQFGIPESTLKKIAYCESHYNPAAISRSGAYGGMFQFSASTWQSTRKVMGLDSNPELRFDAEQAIMTTAFKIKAGGIGAWPVCGR